MLKALLQMLHPQTARLRQTFGGLAILAASTIGTGATLPSMAQAQETEALTVMLDWFVNPDHGPLIVAEDRGYFAEQGLSVTMIAPADPNDPPKLVAAGEAEIAISYQPQLHIQVAEGLPLTRFGTLVATPLNTLVALKDGPIQSIADLKGRKVGYSVGGFEDALLGAMLQGVGLSLSDVELINVNFSLSPSLVSGQVDAVIGAFRNFELNQMDIIERPGIAFYPEEHGVPAYDELIYVTNTALIDDPRLPKFLAAVEKATQYIINHPQESWEIFRTSGPDLDDELNKRAWRDTLPRFALRPAALDTGRYVRFGQFLLDSQLINSTPPVENFAVELSR